MRTHPTLPARLTRRGLAVGTLAVSASLLLSGCASNGTASSGWLPQGTDGGQVTDHTGRVTSLWVGTWIAALAVGLLVWGLTIWVMVRYRRRKEGIGLPPQLRYNVPLEILYTVIPVFMVAVLFYYTARDESALLDVSVKPDVTVNVVAKQWSWDFNYVTADTYEAGTHAQLTGQPGVEKTLPTLYLPVNKRTEFILTSRDVIHSFWVPQFLMKMDIIPGRINAFQVVTTETGTFQGKCAELCGAYHSQMLFNVKVVSQADYNKKMQQLRAKGNVGFLSNALVRDTSTIEAQDQKKMQQYLPAGVLGSDIVTEGAK